jgi:hypothetical protein
MAMIGLIWLKMFTICDFMANPSLKIYKVNIKLSISECRFLSNGVGVVLAF